MNHRINRALRYFKQEAEDNPQTAEELLQVTPIYDRLIGRKTAHYRAAYHDQLIINKAPRHSNRLGIFKNPLNTLKYTEFIRERIVLSTARFTAAQADAYIGHRITEQFNLIWQEAQRRNESSH